MKKLIYLIIIVGVPMFIPQILAQPITENITLLCKTDLNRYYGAGDVLGLKIGSTNYALTAIDGGLSVINTNNPSIPVEITHINKIGYSSTDPDQSIRLQIADVETFTYGGTTYAYLATNNNNPLDPDMPLVIIINLNAAIDSATTLLIDVENDVPAPNTFYAGKIEDFAEINQSHTLTIAGGYLYVSTFTNKIPVWNLNTNPTNPPYLGAATINTPDTGMHEMYVESTGSASSKVYASGLRGGLHVIDLNLDNMSFTRTTQLYDSDKAYADTIESVDPFFDFRFTHSAWPNADGSYIFTTDELAIFSPHICDVNLFTDINLYAPGPYVLRDAHRQGAFLRTWKTSQLGTSSALKGGFYVPEGQQQGVTDLSQINNSMVPSSIHQMFGKGNALYVTHYTQGLRLLDISDPENLVEVGYYDDYVNALNVDCNDPYFFRSSINNDGNQSNWFQGIFGVFPDPNRPGVVYAGSLDEGFYIFDVLPDIAAPTGFTLSGSSGENPVLSWNASSAVGLDGYKLYQSLNGVTYTLRAILNKYTTSFTDNEVL